jgi:hypothetical protein
MLSLLTLTLILRLQQSHLSSHLLRQLELLTLILLLPALLSTLAQLTPTILPIEVAVSVTRKSNQKRSGRAQDEPVVVAEHGTFDYWAAVEEEELRRFDLH